MTTALNTTLDAIASVDHQLAEIEAGFRDMRGNPPKSELTEAAERLLLGRQEKFSRRRAPHAIEPTGVDLLADFVNRKRAPNVKDASIAFDLLLMLFAPEELRERIAAAVERFEYREALPTRERRAQREALSRERARLIDERERLVDRANELGGGSVSVAQHPETAARRDEEARERRAQAAREAAQREVAAEIERRMSRSSYLELQQRTF